MTRVSPSVRDRRAPGPPSDQAVHGERVVGARLAVPGPWACPSLLVVKFSWIGDVTIYVLCAKRLRNRVRSV